MTQLKLHGFNNLTKSLSCSIYAINYIDTVQHQKKYNQHIDKHYCADRLTEVLQDVCDIIGANVLNTARQNYTPQGASLTMLVSEEETAKTVAFEESEQPGPVPESVVSHLDKSHICIHTYPETHPVNGIAIFRADIEVASCGVISPLKALNFLIHSFNSDIVTLDYRVRGFTRDVKGEKHYIDHKINSIQNFLNQSTAETYQMTDVNVYQENLFHTKMMLKAFDLSRYIFGAGLNDFTKQEQADMSSRLLREMQEIFYGRNLPDM